MDTKKSINWEENLKRNPLLKLTGPAVLEAIGVNEPHLVSKICHDIIMEEITNKESEFQRIHEDSFYPNRRLQPIIQAIAEGGADYRGLRTIELRLTWQMHAGYLHSKKPDMNSVYIVNTAEQELNDFGDQRIEDLVPLSYTEEIVQLGLWWF